MRMKVPITGTVKEIEPFVSGDDSDCIRLINLPLGNVSWKLIHLDIENEEMEIEVTAAPHIVEGEIQRPTTPEEKAQLLEAALDISLERMSKDDLYTLSGDPRLTNPFKK